MTTHALTTEKPDPKRVSRWRERWTAADRELSSRRSPATLLEELGYVTGDGPGTEPRAETTEERA